MHMPKKRMFTMLIARFVVAILSIVPVSAQATNRGYWNLWAVHVGMICFAQNSAYRNTPLGNMVFNSYGFPGWEAFDQRPSAACLRSRQWVSDSLCTDVTNLDQSLFEGDLNHLRRKHETELQGLKDVILYDYRWREPNGSSLPCPTPK